MSFESMEEQRRGAVDAILVKFGEGIDQAEQAAATRTNDPSIRKLMAARMALEYAVLATALEKNVATEVAATALAGANPAQQAMMLKKGAAALGRAYRVEPEVLANVFAGGLVDVDMPKGLGSTPEIDKMVDTCRSLVAGIVKDEYAQRGRPEGSASFVAYTGEGVAAKARTDLAARLAFMEANIGAAVGKGAISQTNADMLRARIEAQVFQPRPPQLLQFSREFSAFFEQRGKGIRIEAMKEVRGVTQSQTVREISDRLNSVMASAGRMDRSSDHRTHKSKER